MVLPMPYSRFMVRGMPSSRRFLRSAGLISGLTLFSRVLGLVREQVFGFYFATSQPLSAFRIAFMLPNLARRLFGEGALSAAFIPVLTRSIRTDGEEQSRKFVGSLLVVLAIALVCGVVAAEVAIVVWRRYSGDLSLSLAAILMPYMALICLVAAVGAVLNVRGHFALPAAAPSLLNLSLIGGILTGAVFLGLRGVDLIYVACVSVLVGGVCQLTASLVMLGRIRFLPIISAPVWSSRIKSVGGLMAPMVLGLSAVQLNTLADFLIAYFFVEEGGERVGPAVMGYAQYLYQLPLGVFGIALATAIFQLLSQKAAEEDALGLAEVFSDGLRLSVFVALPASVGLMFVAHPLVAALYERGAFGPAQTDRVAGVLLFYSLGLVAYFMQHIVVRTFYALHDSKTPARVALTMVFINLAMNLSLVFVLEERGLALATAVCAVIQVLVLLRVLSCKLPTMIWGVVLRSVVRSLVATALMAGSLVLVEWVGLARAGATWETFALVVTGAAVYAMVSRCFGAQELSLILRRT